MACKYNIEMVSGGQAQYGFYTCAVCGNTSFSFPQGLDSLNDLDFGSFAASSSDFDLKLAA